MPGEVIPTDERLASQNLSELRPVLLEGRQAQPLALHPAAHAAAGLPVTIGSREFFHMLLKNYADKLGLQWPQNYPKPGGWRGGPKDKRPKEA
jgi:hypothetical protein